MAWNHVTRKQAVQLIIIIIIVIVSMVQSAGRHHGTAPPSHTHTHTVQRSTKYHSQIRRTAAQTQLYVKKYDLRQYVKVKRYISVHRVHISTDTATQHLIIAQLQRVQTALSASFWHIEYILCYVI